MPADFCAGLSPPTPYLTVPCCFEGGGGGGGGGGHARKASGKATSLIAALNGMVQYVSDEEGAEGNTKQYSFKARVFHQGKKI